ncbi:glycosyltransferase family 4 protein [Candidatus Collierbacteria bacterium CG10_big_fil_rev_8_21_14_0_10_44_9]|uniref:Glycosyltransferase family 4 protein n=1 Tax=Candidatus Collierbacteria bacterium CG10_big_fil_rev_8_21_14_0_10_44_9 TaxID=1974535 RepID=A0A2H0VJ50_9BACT|nr:MAG: glycosyltransferase family 4 protein [Candidatus Collierbacteria bacterium CG10_big_fil_rev_8_21_14_0_10_44_9]
MAVALVYDRINKIGGAEQVLLAFNELYPEADWYTGFWNPLTAPFSRTWRVHSFRFLHNHHEWFPWIMPFIFESFDFGSYDLVISIGSAESKGIITRPGTVHLNYCLTPTRYLYSHKDEYLSNPVYRFVANILRKWDLVASIRPDEMIAISTQVKNRIKKYYKRDSDIVFPPVDVNKYYTSIMPTRTLLVGEYFLTVSRLVSYKKIDVLIKAANHAQVNLMIIGEGAQYKKLKALAGPTVTFLGLVPDKDLPKYYQNCKAFLHAGEEDFGIGMVEAQAAGRPVIAYREGGAQDIVIPGKTGILLEENSIVSFTTVLKEFDTMTFDPLDCQNNAQRFDKSIWMKQISERINQICQTYQK